jgi:hypothetical protein
MVDQDPVRQGFDVVPTFTSPGPTTGSKMSSFRYHFRQPFAPSGPAGGAVHATVLPPPGNRILLDDGSHLAISPDGARIAFVAVDVAGARDVWLMAGVSGRRSPAALVAGWLADPLRR